MAMIVSWVETQQVTPCGHGVEFHHNAFESSELRPIAFLEGFEWMRGNKTAVTVRIRNREALMAARAPVNAETVIKDVRDAVLFFLDDRRRWRHGSVTESVTAVFNA